MKKDTTNEELARMIAKGFENVDRQFGNVDKQFENIDKKFENVDRQFKSTREEMNQRFSRIDARLSTIERDIRDLVRRDEFEDLMARVKFVEVKLGINSGK